MATVCTFGRRSTEQKSSADAFWGVLNRLENVGETLRAALNSPAAAAAPEWLVEVANPEWKDQYSKRIEDYRLPKLIALK